MNKNKKKMKTMTKEIVGGEIAQSGSVLPRPIDPAVSELTDVTQFSRKSSISPQYLGSIGFDKPQNRERLRNVS